MAFTQIKTGISNADAQLAGNVKPHILRAMAWLKPYQAPISQFLLWSNRKSVECNSKYGKLEWAENEFYPHKVGVTADITGGSTLTLTSSNVDHKEYFQLDDNVFIEATQQMGYISSITAGGGSDVVITPWSGTLSTVPYTSGTLIKIIGNARIENNTIPTPKYTQEVLKYNYNQIFTYSVGMTGRDDSGDTFTDGTSMKERTAQKMEEMRFDIERALIYNLGSYRIGSGDNAKTMTKGLLGWVTTNVSTITGALTEDQFDNFLYPVFSKGSRYRQLHCGGGALQAINKFIKDKQKFEGNTTTEWGINILKYHHAIGEVEIIYNPVLDGAQTNWALAIDLENVKGSHQAAEKSTGKSRKLRVEPNVEVKGTDRTETKMLADVGIIVQNEETCGILKVA